MPASSTPDRRRVRVFCYCSWAERLLPAAEFLARLPGLDIAPYVASPANQRLMQMARLDCDWHAETVRVLAALAHAELEFLPAAVLGTKGLGDLVAAPRPPTEEWWLVFSGQDPKSLGGVIGRTLAFLVRKGVRTLFYAFDEASRNMRNFTEVAPHLDVLIHDESPLSEAGRSALNPRCLTIHRSWVANLLPFAVPFEEQPEEKILFLGSQLGYTPHRRRQVEFLQARFKDRMVAIHDHSFPVAERHRLNRFKVGFCPEGRMFTTPGMRFTHTDRPFWSGCLGMVPVSEDSRQGGRLDELHRAGLILRYPHGDLSALVRACDEALSLSIASRRRIFDHFNRSETVGTVVAEAIHAAGVPPTPAPESVPSGASPEPAPAPKRP